MTRQSPKVHRDVPTAPEPWYDPDPLTIEPEDVKPGISPAIRAFLLRLAIVGAVLTILALVAVSRSSAVIPSPGPAWALGESDQRTSGAPHRPVATAADPSTVGAPQGEASSFVVAAPALRHGVLSYVDAKYGSDYLALPEPRGTVAEICGPGGCVTRRSNDYGPDQRVHPNRIADLSATDFVLVCGVPLSVGLCEGTVEIEPPVDPADDATRVEDGGPQVTVPPTNTEGTP